MRRPPGKVPLNPGTLTVVPAGVLRTGERANGENTRAVSPLCLNAGGVQDSGKATTAAQPHGG
jgi:hypothetical protein